MGTRRSPHKAEHRGGGIGHGDRAGRGVAITRGIDHRVGEEIGAGGVYIHGAGDGDGIGQIPIPQIVPRSAWLRPGLPGLLREPRSPEEFHFGVRGIWLDCLETNTEADIDAAEARGVAVALSRTKGRPAAVPGTTPTDPRRARCRADRVGEGTAGVVCFPVMDPFPDIAVHIKKAPGVGPILPQLSGLFKITSCIMCTIPVIIGTGGIDIISPRVDRGSTGPAGIFPLGFRGQGIFPARRQATGGLLYGIELGKEDLGIRPGYYLHRSVASLKLAGVRTQALAVAIHHRLVLGLGDLILTQVKPMGQGDCMRSLIPSTARLIGRTAPGKAAGGAENHFQADRGHGVMGRCAVHL